MKQSESPADDEQAAAKSGTPLRVPARKAMAFPSEPKSGEVHIEVKRSDSLADQTERFETSSPSSRISYGLGIPSLILGILAFLFSWIPVVGLLSMPLSGLGLLLGIAGLVVAIIQRGRGIGFPVAGSAVSLVALVIGVFWLGLLGQVIKRVDTAAKQNDLKDILAGAGQKQEQNNLGPRKPHKEKDAPWADASKGPIQHGDVRVQLGGVVVRNVLVRDVLGEETVSPTKNLTIQVSIENTSTTRKIDFLGWSGAAANAIALTDLLGGAGRSKANVTEALTAPERHAASLTDNFGNPYKRMSLDLGAQIPGQVSTATSIYPGKRLEDLLVFEPPVDKVRFLRLELPAMAFGATGSLRLQIPMAIIRR